MTRKQGVRLADVLDNFAVALALGAGGDLAVWGKHVIVDLFGFALSLGLLSLSQMLTRRLGGPNL